jgi:hypothetical protein
LKRGFPERKKNRKIGERIILSTVNWFGSTIIIDENQKLFQV